MVDFGVASSNRCTQTQISSRHGKVFRVCGFVPVFHFRAGACTGKTVRPCSIAVVFRKSYPARFGLDLYPEQKLCQAGVEKGVGNRRW